MKDDNDFPRLTPPDDRYPTPDGLLRRPEELTDDQFDLLAAAWAEGSLEGDSLAELNAVITAIPSRSLRAQSFRRVKLTPYNDRWIYKNSLQKQSPATKALRRTLVISLLAAAAVVAIIITGPAIRVRTILPGAPPEGAVMSEALIPEAHPIIIPDRVKEEPGALHRTNVTGRPAAKLIASMTEPARTVAASDIADRGIAVADDELTGHAKAVHGAEMAGPVKSVPGAEMTDQPRTLPVTLAIKAVNPSLIMAAVNTDLRAVQMADIIPTPIQVNEDNWILRGISLLAKSVTKEGKNIDGYVIASACVNGINNVLGWEMQLKQANNKAGEPVAVNFSSSLLSFSAPVNKNSP